MGGPHTMMKSPPVTQSFFPQPQQPQQPHQPVYGQPFLQFLPQTTAPVGPFQQPVSAPAAPAAQAPAAPAAQAPAAPTASASGPLSAAAPTESTSVGNQPAPTVVLGTPTQRPATRLTLESLADQSVEWIADHWDKVEPAFSNQQLG